MKMNRFSSVHSVTSEQALLEVLSWKQLTKRSVLIHGIDLRSLLHVATLLHNFAEVSGAISLSQQLTNAATSSYWWSPL